MIVKTRSPYQGIKVLKNAIKLGNMEEWRQLYINRDMTGAIREQDYELRKELKDVKRA